MQSSADGRKERWARSLIGLYLLAAAVSALMWLLQRVPRQRRQSPPEIVFGALNVPLSPSLVSVVVLVIVSGSLLNRKRLALWAVGAFQVTGGLISVRDLVRLLVHMHPEPTWAPWGLAVAEQIVLVLLSIAGVALVIWLRPAFPARPLPGSWLRAGAILFSGAIATIGITHLLLVLAREEQGDDLIVLRVAMVRAIGLSGNTWRPDSFDVPDWIPHVAALMLSATLLGSAWVFLRSAHWRDSWSPDRELRVRQLLAQERHPDSLGYFATRRDKAIAFSDDGRAAIAYRVLNTVCLASGDPLGPRDAWPAAIATWLRTAREYGWSPAVLATSEDGARAYLQAGLKVVRLGDEAVVHPDRFTLASTSMTAVRRAVAQARRQGLVVTVRRHGQIPPEKLTALAASADAWRDGPDRGFSMALNRLGDAADDRCVMVTAHLAAADARAAADANGGADGGADNAPAVAILSFVPWGRHGLSLDVMRRAGDCPPGATELMVAELMSWSQRQGIRRVSLNFAMFRDVLADAERLGAAPLRRVQSSLLGALDRVWQLGRLYRANEKYRPEWVGRYVCLDQFFALPRVVLAIGRVEGFIPIPTGGRGGSRVLDDEHLTAVRALPLGPSGRAPSVRRPAVVRHRIRHLRELARRGRPGYPVGLAPAVGVERLGDLDADAGGAPLRVTGRVRRKRRHGGVTFLELSGGRRTVQVIVEETLVGAAAALELARYVDIGDLIVVDGCAGRSRTGTPSLIATAWTMAAKALQPVPFDGLTDPEQQRRRRATDLVVHPEKLNPLIARSLVVATTRRFLTAWGFAEVETPILNTVHGGASARPFRTYINAYGADLTLRIAPELYLKRLLVAGAGPIFEIGRNFRNEGADATHNPEFTSLEAYQPYADYHDMRRLAQALIQEATTALHGTCVLPLPPDTAAGTSRTDATKFVDVSGSWPVVPVLDAVSAAVGSPVTLDTDFEDLVGLARQHGVALHDEMGPGAVIEELYGALVEPATRLPTFYVDFPEETSPLTGPHRSLPGLVERWDLVVGGMELGTAYSELTDPLIQRRRLTDQSLKAAAGDPEAMAVDEDFLHDLEVGMPPAGGLGIGIDRLVMALTGTQIRDVLTFPFVRPMTDQG